MRLQIRAALAAAAAHPPQLPLRRTTMDSAAGSRRTTQQSAVASADSKRGSATGSVGALLAPPPLHPCPLETTVLVVCTGE